MLKSEKEFSISDVCVRELLNFIFDAGSVVLQDRIIYINTKSNLMTANRLCKDKTMSDKPLR
mgnify:CR=1 FL=1